jgi:hypothetical protein
MKAFLAIAITAVPAFAADAPDFTRDVRPILSNYCYKCHGPDDKTLKAKLRLDVRESATGKAKSDSIAIVPGKPDESELVARIFSKDEEEVMPPPSMKKVLTPEQKDVLKRWIAAGAEYKQHWSFVAPKKAKLPPHAEELRNPIDAFIAQKLAANQLKMSPEADAATLCRRLHLDLIGLPPTPAEVDAFVKAAAENRQAAIESLADKLLASPQYGERWARRWLDLARYADTNGYEKDRERSIWPWRDWVINALNADMPFDQFTIEQIAGDLLPGATREQKVATGFHRNTMLNEEGGIDPLEFRFNAMTDRVATTGATWLGLTLGCAQCHTHKYDPIPHSEYFQMMAFMDNADELDLDLPSPEAVEAAKLNAENAAKKLAELPEKYPLDTEKWTQLRPLNVQTASGAQAKLLNDNSALFPPNGPEKETTTIVIESESAEISELKLEALADASFPNKAPGRAKSGSFVLTEISVLAATKSAPDKTQPVKIARAESSANQPSFPAGDAIDGKPETGWGVDLNDKKMNVNRSATFTFEKPIQFPGGTRLVVKLEQQWGQEHTLGRVRLSVGAPPADSQQIAARRKQALEKDFSEWLANRRKSAIHWQPLVPVEAKSNLPLLTVRKDASILASGDFTKSDTYELKFRDLPAGVTAVRLEALPDDSLPAHGPGMAYYEGPKGDFFLGEFQLSADGQPVRFPIAIEDYSNLAISSNRGSAKLATDGDTQTGWSTANRPGERHMAIFRLAAPAPAAKEWTLKMIMGRHYACSLGCFRISVTTGDAESPALDMAQETEALLNVPDDKLTAAQRGKLREAFLLSLPQFANDAKTIRSLLKPAQAKTTLVFQERPASNPRPTFLRNRGEYLQPLERVEPGVLSVLNPLPKDTPPNRLAYAKWLVARENPLTARVVANRAWAAFFGRGLVKTTEDFGLQGDTPSHPELLDWLAVEFMDSGWSQKKLHRLIVTSATYRQSSRTTPEALARDPENRLLAHFPRVRLDAEIIRDSTLRASDLLALKIGGPSVRPPQPASVTETAYGGGGWNASNGEDRYRRSLYTFSKRTAPFGLYNTFDAPTGESCITHRDVSNTSLQALSLLNDVIFLEASRALGKILTTREGSVDERVNEAYLRVLGRKPADEERTTLAKFYEAQQSRFAAKELDAAKATGEKDATPERAAWTVLARALFNLDEAVTKG